jgi:hypothetical protein
MVKLGCATMVAPVKADVVLVAGFKISAVFRRNFGEYFVFGGNRKMVYRCFPVFSVSNFKISKKFINNRPKNQKKLGAFISL